MISQIKNNLFTKFLWGFIGLLMLNISIDSTNFHSKTTEIDTKKSFFNKQESIIELIVELILDYENAIKEYDNDDLENLNKKPSSIFNLIHHKSNYENSLLTHHLAQKKIFDSFPPFVSNKFIELDTPPPKI